MTRNDKHRRSREEAPELERLKWEMFGGNAPHATIETVGSGITDPYTADTRTSVRAPVKSYFGLKTAAFRALAWWAVTGSNRRPSRCKTVKYYFHSVTFNNVS